ncbi:Flavoprotein [Actinokineospora alba]|uniref:Flavoprotein n=1 Tax=Actinokineospora alba TaxID=504798 RepID=A0A1H0QUB6_9PSEU|nr:flavoprotein [Actinokineospora alba]TDP70396.1 flavoprotein [Actinokineospora alba]SDI32613.1 Flavoprotein [Actinokineospora alba]SDP20735.1 Flavoprotein [Actinokineospora alba]
MDPEKFYLRHPATAAVGSKNTFLLRDATTQSVVTTDDPPALSRMLQLLATPLSGRDLLNHLDGEAQGARSAVEALLADGMLHEADTPETLLALRDEVFGDNQGYCFQPGPVRCRHLVLAMTGSVVAGLMGPVILSLAYSRFHERIDLIVTESAKAFVQPEMYEYYGIRTFTDPFERREGMTVPHIGLAKSADLIAVVPASARSIARLAAAECSDLLSLVAAATTAPIVVAPTMNTAMWDNQGVRRNVDRLRADGIYVIEPTIFFEAAELAKGVPPAYGMAGTFWGGPEGLMRTLTAVLDLHKAPNHAIEQPV